MRSFSRTVVALLAVLVGCSTASPPTTDTLSTTTIPTTTSSPSVVPGDRPPHPTGPLSDRDQAILDQLFGDIDNDFDRDALRSLQQSTDARIAWLVADLMRFLLPGPALDDAVIAFDSLTGYNASADLVQWVSASNKLIEWDLPEPPGYVEWKGQLYTAIEPRWQPFFDDPESTIDFRYLTWGGVRPDDRPLGGFDTPCAGGCIPALDDPATTDAAGGSWYPDDAIVFGVDIGGEARAYPKNIMEIHEMVIDTVGGTRIGMPYCTLCGSAQAYDLDSVPATVDRPLLRTSGLLVRSNKLMFDLNTFSAFDTFTGAAVSGPLREAGVELDQISVVVATWGDWKAAHPNTTIVAEDGGIGRRYDPDPLGGRDAGGPIFPIGKADERLPVQTQVLGVEFAGNFLAFPVDQTTEALAEGQSVEMAGVTVSVDAGGLSAFAGQDKLASHQSFWFAWSQFHPETLLWQPVIDG